MVLLDMGQIPCRVELAREAETDPTRGLKSTCCAGDSSVRLRETQRLLSAGYHTGGWPTDLFGAAICTFGLIGVTLGVAYCCFKWPS